MCPPLGMHNIRLFADIRHADTLQLIWPINDTNIYVYFFLTPNCRDLQVSSVVEFTYSIIMQTLTVMARRQMQDVIFIPCANEE